LVEKVEGRAHQSPELAARIQSLNEEIGRFDQWQQDTSDQLTSLQRGSFSQRSSMLQADQDRLFDQVNNGSLSIAQMVKQSRAQLDHYFPETPAKGAEQTLPLAEREESLKKIVADAPDYLMDWYNNLFQLQGQVSGPGQRTATEAETASDLAKTQQIAREALGKFDIQPEAIQIGQTSYDRRLHEAALVRQSPQFPVNTVIEVHKCGFRKMSTGEVLRRPHVVVAGAAAG
jgi:molecular chaperone GrpE (heat shock protein)